jgi:hypothetical protein
VIVNVGHYFHKGSDIFPDPKVTAVISSPRP